MLREGAALVGGFFHQSSESSLDLTHGFCSRWGCLAAGHLGIGQSGGSMSCWGCWGILGGCWGLALGLASGGGGSSHDGGWVVWCRGNWRRRIVW